MHSCFVFLSCRTSPAIFIDLHKKCEDKFETEEEDEIEQFKPFQYEMVR